MDITSIFHNDLLIPREKAQSLYGKNEIRSVRKISGALKPRCEKEVADIVKTAIKHQLSLYPVSTGNNWGYGAATPVRDGCIVLDLSLMNRILEMNEELGLVTVEPGVTQKQLREYLDENRSKYLVPVSGAGPHCSLLGNALERGYGITPFTDHFQAVTALKAVLADGSVYSSAINCLGGETADKIFKWGLGPYLEGLFTQGNFGIVTQGTIALAPIPQRVEVFLFSLKRDDDLERTIIAVRDILKELGGMGSSINVMNPHRVLSMVEEYPFSKVEKNGIMSDDLVEQLMKKNLLNSWTIGGILYGNRGIVKAGKKIVKKRLKGIAQRLLFFSKGKIDLLRKLAGIFPSGTMSQAKKQLVNLDESFKVALGSPSEIALPLCYWKSGKRPDKGRIMNPARDDCGLLWYSPLVPMTPEAVRKYVEMVKSVCSSNSIEPLITLTSFSPKCFDSTVPILFEPNNEDDTKRAKKCYVDLFNEGKKHGFLPYRVGIDHMDLILDETSAYWQSVAKIKMAMDPKGIISPGRYCPSK